MNVSRRIYFLVPAFFVECAAFMLGLTQPIDARDRFAASGFQLGLLGMLSNGGYAIMAFYAGRLSDRTGRRPWLLVGLGSQIVLALLLPLTRNYTSLLIVSILQLTLLGCWWAPFMSLMTETANPAALGKVLGKFNVSWCVGAMLGSSTNVWLFNHFGGTRGPYLGAAVYFGVALAIVGFCRPAGRAIADDMELELHPRVGHFKALAWLALASNFFVGGMMIYLFPRLAEAVEDPLAPGTISLLHVLRFAAMLGTFALMGRSVRWHFRNAPYHVSYGLLIATLILTATLGRPGLLALPFIGVGVALGVAYMLSIYYSTLEAEKGSNLGFHEMLLALGATTGPIYGGLLMKFTGSPATAFWLGALPMAAIWVIHVMIRRKPVKE
ncbi:MFS transporter [bacterium]|nr:MFS transporter [bacterium]